MRANKHLLPQRAEVSFFQTWIEKFWLVFFPAYMKLVINSADPSLKSLLIPEGKEMEKELWDSLTEKCLFKRSSSFTDIFPIQIANALSTGLLQSFRCSLPFPPHQSQVALQSFCESFSLKVQIKVHLFLYKHQWMFLERQVENRSNAKRDIYYSTVSFS